MLFCELASPPLLLLDELAIMVTFNIAVDCDFGTLCCMTYEFLHLAATLSGAGISKDLIACLIWSDCLRLVFLGSPSSAIV